ncbi:MAG: ankyrin repeat domain-containing protein, partial [Gammaproteobacteria bacterium]|nr:ankyrin repeat domain-containing protein [Gammaproteobacteria bacterium]
MSCNRVGTIAAILFLANFDGVSADSTAVPAPMEGLWQGGEEVMGDWMPLFNTISPSPQALPSAILKRDRSAVVAALREGAAVDNRENWLGETPLHLAIHTAQPTMVQLLLDNGADPGLCSLRQGYTPLHLAGRLGETAIVRMLIYRGANINAGSCRDDRSNPGHRGDTVLHEAAFRGDLKMIDLLIKEGAEVNVLNDMQSTPLHWAALAGHELATQRLIAHQVDVNRANRIGVTALHWAVSYGHLGVVRALLYNG